MVTDRHIWGGEPATVAMRASWDAIHEFRIDTLTGAEWDTVQHCIAVRFVDDHFEFETIRTIEAMRQGEPNAGRQILRIPGHYIDEITADGEIFFLRNN